MKRFILLSILLISMMSVSTYALTIQQCNSTAQGENITIVRNICVYTYKTNGTFNITSGSLNVRALVVAGGGGGGAGGGGGGGLIYNTSYLVSGNFSIVVGLGGIGKSGFTASGDNGQNSSFGLLNAKGGGGGAGDNPTTSNPPGNGGSGGGTHAGYGASNGGLGFPGQGNQGGNGSGWSPPYYTAGGGGASQGGFNPIQGSHGGDGGNGTQVNLTGDNPYFAGGGGGGSNTAGVGGKGGLGGGADGDSTADGINNTGGGGGGDTAGALGGFGGKGIVIIAYDYAQPININFNNQTPADISSTNVVANPLNITYNITAGTTPVNYSSIIISFKSNSTTRSTIIFINGTNVPEWTNQTYVKNISDTFYFTLFDNEIYPGTYNIADDIIENTSHDQNQLTTNNNFVSMEFLNLTNSTQYNFVEIMSNSTAIQLLYYCNSSYSFTTSVLTSTNCVNFNTIPANQPYNHTHTIYSSHQVIPMVINLTTGTISGIVVTAKSYIILRGNNGAGSAVNYYSINNLSRNGAMRTTGDAGLSWNNQTYTIDSHIHQFSGNSSLYYYVCASDTTGLVTCSSTRSDLLDLGGIPPTAPSIINPVQSNYYSRTLTINYTQSFSPNAYTILYYNISLLNQDFSFNKSIIQNNSINLSYIWNITNTTNGVYIISVKVYDNSSQSATGFSGNFTIDNNNPNITIISPINNTNSNSGIINFTANGSDSIGIKNITLSIYNKTSNTIVNQTSTSFIEGILNYILGVPVSLIDGIYYFFFNIYDFASNVIFSQNNTLTIDTQNPSIQYGVGTQPNNTFINANSIYVNISGGDLTETNVTFRLYGATTTSTCYQETANLSNILDGNCGLEYNGNYSIDSGSIYNLSGIDGDWNTYTLTPNIDNYIYMNYTKPLGALNTSLWEVKYGETPVIKNLTINDSCWNAFTNKVVFRVISSSFASNIRTNFYCNNGTGWENVSINLNEQRFYEEAMVWKGLDNITNSTTLGAGNRTFNWTNLNQGKYFYQVFMVDITEKTNSTPLRTITLDTQNPQLTLVEPANNTQVSNTNQNFTANVTDNIGIKNITFSIYNKDTGSIVQNPTFSLPEDVTSINIGNTFNLLQGVYEWYYKTFDYAGNINISENRTFMSNISPIVILNSPTNNLVVLNNTLVLFNATILSINHISNYSFWNDYDGNFSIKAIITPFLLHNKTTNFTFIVNNTFKWNVQACDTQGNCYFASNNRTIIPSVFMNLTTTETFSDFVTNSYLFTATEFYDNNTISYVTGTLNFNYDNGSIYKSFTMVNQGSGNISSFSQTMDLPSINGTYHFSFFIDYLNTNTGTTYESFAGVFDADLADINLGECNFTPVNITALNFTTWYQEDNSRVKPFNFQSTLFYFLGNGTTYKNFSFNNNSVTEKLICVDNDNLDYKVSGEIIYQNDSFQPGSYLLNRLHLMDENFQIFKNNITMYFMNGTLGTSFIIKVQDISQNPLVDYFVYIYRYYPATDTYLLVQTLQTDNSGQTIANLIAETTDYKIVVTDAFGNIVLTTAKRKIIPTSTPYTIILTIGQPFPNPAIYVSNLTGLSYSLSYNKNTFIVSYVYTDSNTSFQTSNLVLTFLNASGNNRILCNVSSADNPESLICNITGNLTGTYSASAYITRNGITTLVDQLIINVNNVSIVLGNNGLLIGFFIILICAFAFAFNEVAGVIFINVGIIFVNLMGLINFGWIAIFGIIGASILILIVLERS